ncbi:hypothetical protein EMIHUDRAFT_457776 [Emiliania huxleyi CCMP1516]|uniref:Uncharacterized protein n=2 Tax=Emiliania huxleyi TaxID=2903 RepID=A0A0D3JLJ5_EMIH1|nr:hypothetical protein EMIHUDRAFT_457776 [Emiliania huxleyi CCMP1516]EOD24380.1 hypothetical protein EMIHUDRAFT_457776 [Emiliania huxleyi CCMP1516]|eukprot:XP_005776809.1 hypothetical protein EMIHUDRAFT_457776 [Emiliania huxleyi CCMP1516]
MLGGSSAAQRPAPQPPRPPSRLLEPPPPPAPAGTGAGASKAEGSCSFEAALADEMGVRLDAAEAHEQLLQAQGGGDTPAAAATPAATPAASATATAAAAAGGGAASDATSLRGKAPLPPQPPSPAMSAGAGTSSSEWHQISSQLGAALGWDGTAMTAASSLGLAPLSPPMRSALGEAVSGCDSIDSSRGEMQQAVLSELSNAALELLAQEHEAGVPAAAEEWAPLPPLPPPFLGDSAKERGAPAGTGVRDALTELDRIRQSIEQQAGQHQAGQHQAAAAPPDSKEAEDVCTTDWEIRVLHRAQGPSATALAALSAAGSGNGTLSVAERLLLCGALSATNKERVHRAAPKVPPRKKCEACGALNPTARQHCCACGTRFVLKQKKGSLDLPPLRAVRDGMRDEDLDIVGGDGITGDFLGDAASVSLAGPVPRPGSSVGSDKEDEGEAAEGRPPTARKGVARVSSWAPPRPRGKKVCPSCTTSNDMLALACSFCSAKFCVKQTAQLRTHGGGGGSGGEVYAELEPQVDADSEVAGPNGDISTRAFGQLPLESQILVMQEKAAQRLLAQTLARQMAEEVSSNPELAADPRRQLELKQLAQQQLLYQMALACHAAAPNIAAERSLPAAGGAGTPSEPFGLSSGVRGGDGLGAPGRSAEGLRLAAVAAAEAERDLLGSSAALLGQMSALPRGRGQGGARAPAHLQLAARMPNTSAKRLLKQLADFNPSGNQDSAANVLLPNEKESRRRGSSWSLQFSACGTTADEEGPPPDGASLPGGAVASEGGGAPGGGYPPGEAPPLAGSDTARDATEALAATALSCGSHARANCNGSRSGSDADSAAQSEASSDADGLEGEGEEAADGAAADAPQVSPAPPTEGLFRRTVSVAAALTLSEGLTSGFSNATSGAATT